MPTVTDGQRSGVPSVNGRVLRVAYFVSHPIQYQAPLLRRLAQEQGIELKVFFFSDLSMKSYADPGFGVSVKWDIPLTEGYEYEFLPRFRDRGRLGFAEPICRGILSRLGKGNFDAVWLHGYHTLNHLHVLLACSALGLPVLLRTDSTLTDRKRGGLKLRAKRLFFRLMQGLVAGVLPVSHANADYWREYFGSHVPHFPMPYAVDNEFFQTMSRSAAPNRESLRAELQLDPSRPVILYASKLQTRKRCIDLVEACLQLCDQTPEEKKPYLLIVGDGEERTNIEARIRQTSTRDIRLLGFRNQTELPRFFDLCDVFVLPSALEPYGLIVNEAMNAARAVIVSDQVGCHRDLVEDGVNGFVFPAGDVTALRNALQEIILSPETAIQMGRKSLERIQRFSFDADVIGFGTAVHAVAKVGTR